MYKKRKLRVLLRFFSILFVVLFLIFSVIHLYLGQTLRAVEDQYMEETAILYVKNINRKIQSINLEFLTLANNLRDILPGIPQNISPRDGGYYDMLFMASDLVGSLKTRYPELKQSFLYWPASDLLAFSTGLSFASTDDFGITGQVKQRLRLQKDSLSTYVRWEILTSGEETYMLGWYRQKEIMLACLIDLNQIFAEINDMPKSYSVISFLLWHDGRVIAPQAYREQAEQAIADGAKNVYTYPLSDFGTAYIQKVEDGKVLRNVHIQLGLLNMEMGLFWLEILVVIWLFYKRLFHPFTQFITGLEAAEKEEDFNKLSENNILELEDINRKFKILLHRLKDMRIALYEQEITKKQTELAKAPSYIRWTRSRAKRTSLRYAWVTFMRRDTYFRSCRFRNGAAATRCRALPTFCMEQETATRPPLKTGESTSMQWMPFWPLRKAANGLPFDCHSNRFPPR